MKAVRLDSQERGFPLITDDSDPATPGSLCRDIILASDQHDAPKLEFRRPPSRVIVRRERRWTPAGATPARETGPLHPVAIEAATELSELSV